MSSADAPPAAPSDVHPADPPPSLLEKIGAGLPIALTAIATAFAGLSTSEMSRAMYWRSAAAQDQAKTNDQWTLAGSKRDRALIVQTTADQLRVAAGYRPLATAVESTPTPEVVRKVGAWLEGKGDPPVDDQAVKTALDLIRDRAPESDQVRQARGVNRAALDKLITAAATQAETIDREWKKEEEQTGQMARDAAAAAGKAKGNGDAVAAAAAARAARLEVDQRRYRAEATLNFWVGYLYEVRVQTSNATSDRHRDRSGNFFYAMLVGQVGATLGSLSLARKQRSLLWALAGAAGVVAVAFGVYVYLGM